MKNNYLILLFVICLIFFLPFLIRPDFLTIKDNDLGRQYVPLFSFIKDSLYSYKQIPLWRPEQMMGESLIGNPHSSLLYPFNIVFLIFPVQFASIFYFLIHFLLAAIFTYFLARSFNLSHISALAAALFYAFSTKMLLHLSAGHITMLAAFSYFPLFFLSARKTIISPSFRWIIPGGIFGVFMYFTYPTIFYYATIFVFLYWLYYLISSFFTQKHGSFLVFKTHAL